MNRTHSTLIVFVLLVALAGCTDVVPVEVPDGAITGNQWGTTDVTGPSGQPGLDTQGGLSTDAVNGDSEDGSGPPGMDPSLWDGSSADDGQGTSTIDGGGGPVPEEAGTTDPNPETCLFPCEPACEAGQACIQGVCVGQGSVSVALIWSTSHDLDLYVTEPSGEQIYYDHTTSATGGQLDVDSHVGCSGSHLPGVENVFWPLDSAPLGTYEVSVRNYSACEALGGDLSILINHNGAIEFVTLPIGPVGQLMNVTQFVVDAIDPGLVADGTVCWPKCGDGSCTAAENCDLCAADCGACPPPVCGDAVCAGNETCQDCPEDCGGCPVVTCGDDVCDAAESCENCANDCGECPPETCGDGTCADDEDCETCADDCGACPSCCEQLFCNPAFEECLPTEDGEDCFCDPIYEICLFMGDNCPPGYQQPDPFVCVDYGGDDGICRVACEGPPIGLPDTCEGAEWLCAALPGDDGYCLPADCSGYFDDDFDACGPDATCLPTLDQTNVCVPDGPDDEGDFCGLHNECEHGLLCIDNLCSVGECSVDSNQVPCADGITCMAWTVGVDELSVGNCAADCIVFTDTGCEADEWCFPLANTPDEGPIDGYCVPSGGTAFEGMKCDLDPNACVDGTSCVVSPENEVPTCEPLCAPSAAAGTPGSCEPGRGCSPLFMVNEWGEVVEVLDYGSCVPSCTPWVDQGLSGCGGDTWCTPMLFNSHAGECGGVLGELEEGDDCTEVGLSNSCGQGLFCFGFMTPLGMDGICHRLCDVDGGAGATCAEDQLCDPIEFTGANDKEFAVAVGVCVDNPDWVPPAPEGCQDGQIVDCSDACVDASLLGNATCDEALNCALTDWDAGDCPEQ